MVLFFPLQMDPSDADAVADGFKQTRYRANPSSREGLEETGEEYAELSQAPTERSRLERSATLPHGWPISMGRRWRAMKTDSLTR